MQSTNQNTGHRCPSGRHPMDPNWDVCPYCEGERKSHEQTVYREPEAVTFSDTRKTSIGESASNNPRVTKPMPQQSSPPNIGGYGGQGDKRKIMGVLITYDISGHPEGKVFEVREGKNYIGAGKVNREPGDPWCDIYVEGDKLLSSAHALILCRHGIFEIVDLESTNGTFIDGTMIPIRGRDLPDICCSLRTGSTNWTFMKVVTPAGSPFAPIIPQQPDNKVVDSSEKAVESLKDDKPTIVR
jgi:hypothetical protein